MGDFHKATRDWEQFTVENRKDIRMKEVKIMHISRQGSDFSLAEETIEKMCKEGWELISVSADPANVLKLIVVFKR